MIAEKVDPMATYYKNPVGKSSQFIPKNIQEYPLLPIIKDSDEDLGYIFPMKEVDLKLFYLIQNHKHSNEYKPSTEKCSMPNLKEKYNDFYYNNILSHQKNFVTNEEVISNLHKNSMAYKYEMTKMYIDKHNYQKEVILPKIEKISLEHKNEAEVLEEKEVAKENELRQKEDEEAVQRSINQSSRNNIIVDEKELEELMAKLDPLNKYRQVAVNEIPEMIFNPMDNFMEISYKDVNSLVMNKTKWAEQTTKDSKNKIHAFTEEEEKLFYEGFMLYPKEFGKICKHMKQKKTVSELISYYYHTKLQKNYFEKYLKMKEDLEKEKELKKLKKKSLKQQAKGTSTASTSSTSTATAVAPTQPTATKKSLEREEDSTPKKQTKNKSNDTTPKKPVKKVVITEKPSTGAKSDLESVDGKLSDSKNDGHVKFDIPSAPEIKVDTAPVISNEQVDVAATEMNTTVPETPIESVSSLKETPGISEENKTSELSSPKREDSANVSDFEQLPLGKKRKLSSEISSGSETPSFKKTATSKTSYWSVHEAALFPDLLKKYGKDWKSISADIGTKSVTMIRNYYMKKGKELGFDVYIDEFIQRQKAAGIDVVFTDDALTPKVSKTASPVDPTSVDAKLSLQNMPSGLNKEPLIQPKTPSVLPPLNKQQLLSRRESTSSQGQRGQHIPQPIKPSLELFPQQHNSPLQASQPKITHQLPPLTLRKGNQLPGLPISTFEKPQTVNLPPISSYNSKLSQKPSTFPLAQLANQASGYATPLPINSYNNSVPITPNFMNSSAGQPKNKLLYSSSNSQMPAQAANMTVQTPQIPGPALNMPTQSPQIQSKFGNSNKIHLSVLSNPLSTPHQESPTAGPAALYGRNSVPTLSLSKNTTQQQNQPQGFSVSASSSTTVSSFFDPLSALAAIASNEQKLLEKEEKQHEKTEKK